MGRKRRRSGLVFAIGDVVRLRSQPNTDVFSNVMHWSVIGGGTVRAGSIGIVVAVRDDGTYGAPESFTVDFSGRRSYKGSDLLKLISRA